MQAFAIDRLDRYLLRLFALPLAAVLATLLIAQLLERLLRLFDLAASAGAPLVSVAIMFANLVPHYLGLTLPMSFTAAIFVAAARLADDNELDVMLASGRSMARVAAPFFGLALLLVPVNLYLFGDLQPIARYGYHVAVDAALHTGWNAKLEANRFISSGRGVTFSAGAVDADGLHLKRVFLVRRRQDAEDVITAPRGELVPGEDGLLLQLEDGQIVRDLADGSVTVVHFDRGNVDRDLTPTYAPYRARGDSASERTLPELWQEIRTSGDAKSAAEFNGRLARVAILPLLPLMALPLGMASKRGRRAPGIVFATLALVALNHALQFGQSLAENGRVHPVLAVWTPVALFGLASVWIFRSSLAWPGDNPVLRVVLAFERGLEGVLPRRVRSRPR